MSMNWSPDGPGGSVPAAPLLLSLGAGGRHAWSGAPHPFSLASPSMSHLSAFRGVAIRVAEENGGAACAWPSSAGWLRTSSHCASSRWAHLLVREGGVLLACALHVSGGPRVRHHGFIGSDQHFRQENC
uniref:Uncharacterized protein n=1 Tax=Oryza glumipatula TaxID=40148 RepID=A0A0D9ZM94_9ORYZ